MLTFGGQLFFCLGGGKCTITDGGGPGPISSMIRELIWVYSSRKSVLYGGCVTQTWCREVKSTVRTENGDSRVAKFGFILRSIVR